MPCPTCSHTLHFVGEGDIRIYHCPRCGTLVTDRDAADGVTVNRYVAVPKLVERCRKFESALDMDHDPKAVAEWNRLGIAESISAQGGESE